MSSYQLIHKEERALSYGLDHQIPSKTDPNLIYTEFESYFQSIKHKIADLPKYRYRILKPNYVIHVNSITTSMYHIKREK